MGDELTRPDELTGVIDRVEGRVAVVETASRTFLDVDLSLIDGWPRDGAIVARVAGGRWTVDEGATSERRERVARKASTLFRKPSEQS